MTYDPERTRELARKLARRRFSASPPAPPPPPCSVRGTAAAAARGRPRRTRPAAAPSCPPAGSASSSTPCATRSGSLGFARVFEELARYHYDEVEFAGYTQGSAGAISLAQLKRLLRDNGLRGVGSHVGYSSTDPEAYTFATDLTQVLDDAEALGLPHIGTPSSPYRYGNTVDAWKRAAEEFNTYGAAAKARGMRFYHHNHADEFSFATDDPQRPPLRRAARRDRPRTGLPGDGHLLGVCRRSSASHDGPTAPPPPSNRSTTC